MKSLWLVVALVGCGDRDQIILSVDTSMGIPCDLDSIRIGVSAEEANNIDRELADLRLPFSLTLEDDTSDGTFDLTVSGFKDGVEVLRSSGPLQFGRGQVLAADVVLQSSCTPTSPCALPALIPYVAPPAPTTRSECGANVRRYTPGAATESFRDVCTVPGPNTGKVLADGTRGAVQLPLAPAAIESFGFEFYGEKVRQIWVHEDGYLAFTVDSPDANNDLDAGAFDRDLTGLGVPPPRQAVFAFWDALTLGPDGVCYALEGQPGTQKLRVTWKGTCQTVSCSATNNLNFTVVLDERTDRVSLTYGDMIGSNVERAQGSTATSGIVEAATGCPVAECEYTTGLCADGSTPCGYSQTFSNQPQVPRVENVQFDPIVDPE